MLLLPLEADQLLILASSDFLDEFRAEVTAENAKLEQLADKLRDLEIEKVEIGTSIEASQRTLHIPQAETLRLQGALSSS